MEVRRATSPTIFNVSMPLAGVEYSQALPARTKRFIFKLRAANDCRFCFRALESGTLFVTLPAGASYSEDNIESATPITLYFQSAAAAQVAEIIVWQ
ncbi:MAG: hypothetical protein DDT18_00720 [Actinobacteria bacterium]|nr:hypothetical protein [Actinomycetota bacterium]